MATIALVHGGWHGAWCWQRITPELEARGHQVIAVDLPGADPEATFDDYADVVVRALEAHSADDVVLVGHSLAGMTIPLVPARHPVAGLVYVCALVPALGASFMDQLATEDMLDLAYVAGLGDTDPEGRRGWADHDLARDFMYADCGPEATAQALARLRPQAQAPYSRPCALHAFPELPSTYVLCTEDRLVKREWSRSVACDRVGARLVELPGSHSPMLSRPAELAGVLHTAALAVGP